MQQDSNKKPVD